MCVKFGEFTLSKGATRLFPRSLQPPQPHMEPSSAQSTPTDESCRLATPGKVCMWTVVQANVLTQVKAPLA
jgi:hypothetical protein